MDPDPFDALTRAFAAASSRRAVLGAILGAAVAGRAGIGAARNRHRRTGQRERVTAQASCASPGSSASLNGCNFNNQDLSGADLSGSAMRGTKFRGTNLCGADLSSSQLKDADFRGFASPGNRTNLTRADLSSSGCNGTLFNARTIFCRTKTCTGTVSDRDCPDGVDAENVCCFDADCPAGESCNDGICVPGTGPRLEVRPGPAAACVTVIGSGLKPESLVTTTFLGTCQTTFTALAGTDGGVDIEVCPLPLVCPDCSGGVVDGAVALGVAADGSTVTSPFVPLGPLSCPTP